MLRVLSTLNGLFSAVGESWGGERRSQGCRARLLCNGTMPFKTDSGQSGHKVTIIYKHDGFPIEQLLKGLMYCNRAASGQVEMYPYFDITENTFHLLGRECSPCSQGTRRTWTSKALVAFVKFQLFKATCYKLY
jgi:hypothetical protein